jgi:hypothetical protein
VIAFTYIMTARHLVESSRPISEGTQNPQLKTRRNAAKILVGLTVVFLISYVPYHVFWICMISAAEELYYFHKCAFPLLDSSDIPDIANLSNDQLESMYLSSTFLLLLNPCLNPVALFCTSSPFRQHLKRYLTCFCKTKLPSTDLELARRN